MLSLDLLKKKISLNFSYLDKIPFDTIFVESWFSLRQISWYPNQFPENFLGMFSFKISVDRNSDLAKTVFLMHRRITNEDGPILITFSRSGKSYWVSIEDILFLEKTRVGMRKLFWTKSYLWTLNKGVHHIKKSWRHTLNTSVLF